MEHAISTRWLEHLHPWAERHALKMRFEGLQAFTKFFRVALPHRYLLTGSSTMNILEKTVKNITWFPKVARFTRLQVDEALECGRSKSNATREDSEWSRTFEESWQWRPRVWRGVGQFSLQGHVKGLAKSLQRGRTEMLLANASGGRSHFPHNFWSTIEYLVHYQSQDSRACQRVL